MPRPAPRLWRLAALAVVVGTFVAPATVHAQRAGAPISYYIAPGEPGSGFEEGDLTLARWAIEAWARRIDPPLELVAAPEAEATIHIHWVAAGGGQYGEMRARRVGDRTIADVYVRPDTDGLGGDVARQARLDPLFRDAIVYLTCVHELGHAFGLPHTRDFADIMYSFQFGGDYVAYFMRFRDQLEVREDIRLASPFSAGDEAAFRSLYR